MKNTNISLGQYLKEQRELKGLSIDEAAMETNIAKKYIEALEKDEYGFFPAEMYITGFLTSYIEILELDKELVLSIYRRHVNREQEAPLEEFYNIQTSNNYNTTKKYVRIAVLLLLLVGLVGVAYIFLFQSNNETTTTTQSSQITQVALSDLNTNNSLLIGLQDTIVIMDDNNEKLLTIELLGKENNKRLLKFRIGQNSYSYKNGDILETDIDNNGVNDLRLEIISINNRDIELNIQYQQEQAPVASFFDITPYRNAIRNTIPIATVTNVRTFNVTITASQASWVAYQTDTVNEQQRLLTPGENVRFSFIDGVKLSIGNAGATTIAFGEFTNTIRGGVAGESSQSILYKTTEGNITTLYRSQLR